MNISPFNPKQKLATPLGTSIIPISVPAGFQTSIPSPQPAYTLPCTSHLIPSGAPTAANAKVLLLARNGAPDLIVTSNANIVAGLVRRYN